MSKSHLLSGTPTYRAWQSMKYRCYNPKFKQFSDYGGRGILVCLTWKDSFETFFEDMGERPSSKHSLERINNNEHYTKDNCKWATKVEQASNTRTNLKYRGETAIHASERLGGSKSLVTDRVTKLGWTKEKAFTTLHVNNKTKKHISFKTTGE